MKFIKACGIAILIFFIGGFIIYLPTYQDVGSVVVALVMMIASAVGIFFLSKSLRKEQASNPNEFVKYTYGSQKKRGIPQKINKRNRRHITKSKALQNANNLFIEQHVRIAQGSIELAQTTTNPEIFFSRYDLLIEKLILLNSTPNNVLPKQVNFQELLDQFVNGKDSFQYLFIARSYKKLLEGIATLKTDKGKVNRHNAYFLSLEPYKEKMSPAVISMLEGLQQGDTNAQTLLFSITNEPTLSTAEPTISDKEIPSLINQGLKNAIKKEKENLNPKFHRSFYEEELSFEFSQKHAEVISQLEDKIYSSVSEIGRISKDMPVEQIENAISKCKIAIASYEKAKQFCYSKGKGGKIYFYDMWECCHNSKDGCFSYIQDTIDLLAELEERLHNLL